MHAALLSNPYCMHGIVCELLMENMTRKVITKVKKVSEFMISHCTYVIRRVFMSNETLYWPLAGTAH